MPPTLHPVFSPLLLLLLAVPATAKNYAESIDLTPNPGGWSDPISVETDLRISGEVTPEAAPGEEPHARPVAVQLQLAYRQEGLNCEADATPRVMRVIDRVERNQQGAAGLRSNRRALVAESHPSGARIAAVDGALTRPELDLVRLPADPLDLNALLPIETRIRDGGTWKVDPAAINRLLRVEADTVCEVTGILTGATSTHAKLRFAGPVHGHVDGAEIEIELRGVALFDRTKARLTQLNLGWKETRKVGPATPALEATAKLNVTVQPTADTEAFPVTDLLMAETVTPEERLRFTTADGGWSLLADREWHLVASNRRATTLRRIEQGRVTAVTTLTPAARGLTASDLEKEVRYSLGKQLYQILSTEQGVTPSGLRTAAIASSGEVEGQPAEWRHHVLASERAALTATTTLPAVEGPADDSAVRRMLSSISLSPAPEETAAAEATAVRR